MNTSNDRVFVFFACAEYGIPLQENDMVDNTKFTQCRQGLGKRPKSMVNVALFVVSCMADNRKRGK